jgi:hypothetical protein
MGIHLTQVVCRKVVQVRLGRRGNFRSSRETARLCAVAESDYGRAIPKLTWRIGGVKYPNYKELQISQRPQQIWWKTRGSVTLVSTDANTGPHKRIIASAARH